MFKRFANRALKREMAQYKADNLTLMGKVASLQSALDFRTKERDEESKDSDRLENELSIAKETISELQEKLEELEGSTKVTYASARKVLTKAKLKQLRESLEKVPDSANGFSGSCSVYDNKTKRLSVVQLTSKAQALEIVSRAEKGHVDIVL